MYLHTFEEAINLDDDIQFTYIFSSKFTPCTFLCGHIHKQ